MYSSLFQQYLAYRSRHPEEEDKPGDYYDQYYSFLTDLLGMDKQEAELEVTEVMNVISNLME